MRYLKIIGLLVFVVMSMSNAAVAETQDKIDGCLVTLYNYPAETAQYDVSTKKPPQLPMVLKKNSQVVKTDENIHSRKSLASQRETDKIAQQEYRK